MTSSATIRCHEELPVLSLRHSVDARSDERGISLIELMVALLVLTVVMITTAGIFISAIRGIDEAKRRQTGAALGAEVMEQLRSLPYDAVRAGMPDNGNLADVDNVLNGEVLVSTTGLAVPPPLNPHVRVQRVNNTDYTTRTYVSLVTGTPGYWLTAVIKWTTRSGKPQKVVYRSQAFSPAGCLSTGQHPFSGPCQASLYASAGTSAGSIAVRPAIENGTIVEGLDVQQLEIGLPGLSASSIVEQTTAVAGKTTGTRVYLKRSGAEEALGGLSAISNSDDDPSTAGGAVSSATLTAASPGTLTRASSSGTLWATLGTGSDSGSTRSGVRADTAPSCVGPLGATIEGDQPCGSGLLTTSAAPNALRLALPALNGGVGFDLASVSGPVTTRVRAARHVVVGTPTYCATPIGDGCAVAVIDRYLGSLRLGGLPAVAPTTGISTGGSPLVEVTGLREFVTSVAGVTTSVPGEGATPRDPELTGSLRHWNGNGFTVTDLSTLVGQTDQVNLLPSTYTATYGGVTLTATLELVLHPPAVEVSGASPCSVEACARNVTTDSVVAGAVTYHIRNSSGTLANFTIDIALGGTVAKTSYKDAGA
jgi:type II secretory pathway pseudopilin PulG